MRLYGLCSSSWYGCECVGVDVNLVCVLIVDVIFGCCDVLLVHGRLTFAIGVCFCFCLYFI